MGITKIQVLKKRHFHLSALGIEAASFASLGLRTSNFGLWTIVFFERGENKGEQRYSGKPDGDSRNAQIKCRVESV